MTIGEQLKILRLATGLTQKQMAAGIVSESYYSKVERNNQAIDRTKLVEILKAHDFYVDTFFIRLSDNSDITEFAKIRYNLEAMADVPNKKRLDEIAEKIKKENLELPPDVHYMLLDDYAWYYGNRDHVPEVTLPRVKEFLTKFQNYSLQYLKAFIEMMSLLDLDDSYAILKRELSKYENRGLYNVFGSALVGEAATRFLRWCDLQGEINEKYARYPIDFLRRMPQSVQWGQHQIVGAYYEAILDKNTKMAAKFEKILRKENLQKLINKDRDNND